MIFIDAFFSFAACGRHHFDGDAVIRRLRRGYLATALRLLGITLVVMRLFGPVGQVRLVGHVGLRDRVCAPKRESGSLGRVLWWA